MKLNDASVFEWNYSMNEGDVCVILFRLNKICLLKLRKRKESQQIPKSITYKVK